MARLPLPPAEPIKLSSLAEIARGGMGSVELARAEGGKFHGQLLAIKRLHPNIAQDPQFVGMFLDEAWMTAALKSPNVVQVAAWGNDDKGMFLAVEFVQGVSLARLIKESQTNKEPFAERTVAFIASQICAGLSAAHALRGPDGALLGLVHRDLTPGNILVGFDGAVKIADFGIAKAEERITHTRTGTLKGKPSYMAPEQARGGKVDARADIFSFGVLVFELLAGRKPWLAKSAFDVMMEIATTPPPSLAELRKGVNPDFVAIVEKCLQKKVEDRFSSADEMQKRFDAWRTAKNFTHDDQASMGQFVMRNSAAQIKWFDGAMRGEMARNQKLSFKELEEQIDEAREKNEKKSRQSGLRPAAGQPPSSNPASSPTSPRQPGSAPVQRPSGVYGQGSPSSSEAARGATVPMPTYGTPKAEPAAAAQGPRNLGGTEFMAQSPFSLSSPGESPLSKRVPAGTTPKQSIPLGSAGTIAMPAHDPSAVPPSPRLGHGGVGRVTGGVGGPSSASAWGPPPTPPPSQQLALPPPREASALPPPREGSALPPSREATAPPTTPSAPSSKKSGGSRIVLLLLLVVLGGGGFAAWRYRGLILPPPQSTDSDGK